MNPRALLQKWKIFISGNNNLPLLVVSRRGVVVSCPVLAGVVVVDAAVLGIGVVVAAVVIGGGTIFKTNFKTVNHFCTFCNIVVVINNKVNACIITMQQNGC